MLWKTCRALPDHGGGTEHARLGMTSLKSEGEQALLCFALLCFGPAAIYTGKTISIVGLLDLTLGLQDTPLVEARSAWRAH